MREVRAGDVIWFSPGEKHWHGAGPTTTMSHMAITEMLDGKYVAWMEKVADEQYKQRPVDLAGAPLQSYSGNGHCGSYSGNL